MQESFSDSRNVKPLQSYFLLAKNDFFTPYLLRLTFLPLMIAFVGLGAVLYGFGWELFTWVYDFLHYDFGFSSAWLVWIQSFFDSFLKLSVFIFLLFMYFALSLFISLVVCGFVAPYVVRFVKERHYPSHSLDGNAGLFNSLLQLVGVYVLYLFFLLLMLPLYFIPFVGGILILFPGFWLFSKTMVMDVGGEIFKRESLKAVKKEQKSRILKVLFVLFGLSLIPFLGFFTPVYALSVLAHLFFDLKEKGY